MSSGDRTPVRVQKYISQAGLASRRQAESMLAEGPDRDQRSAGDHGRVSRVVPGSDTVSLDGRDRAAGPRRWVVFHKPAGRPLHPDRSARRRHDLRPSSRVGRAGCVMWGGWTATHPACCSSPTTGTWRREARASERAGRARVPGRRDAGTVTARALRRLQAGRGAGRRTWSRPRRVRRVESGRRTSAGVTLVLTEGRKREVRRMLKAVGHPVRTLVRTRFGPIQAGRAETGGLAARARSSELEAARSAVEHSRARRGETETRSGTARVADTASNRGGA